ncbi:MAG: DegV family protein [Clostridia bacterium]|nr:DegV family protein [Clostridia bacterium]
MSKYVVMTDSACDLPQDLADKHHIDIICFKIALDGEGYTERVDFTPEQFSQMLREAKGLPTTSQVTQFEFFDKFEEYDRAGVEELLYISINSAGSGTNAAAHRAAEEFREAHPDSPMKITIVDSHSYSIVYGSQAVEAAKMLADGKTMDEVVAYLDDMFARLEVILGAYTLKIIRKSGRVSAAAAIAGDLLGIRPIFTLIDGESKVIKKARGDKMVLSSVVNEMKARMEPGTPYWVGFADRKYEAEYVAACEKALGYPPAGSIHLGSAVCANTGPDAAGVLYQGSKRER